jgi:2-oxo-3-hexenedioate decarboxylase
MEATTGPARTVADELISLHHVPREVPPFTSQRPNLTPDQGYAAARTLHQYRLDAGWRPVGRKIGFTNRTIWPRYGVYEPIWGWVYDHTLIEAEADRARVPLAGLVNPRLEPEVCFGLKEAPPASAAADPERLLAAIDWVAHSVEIVQSYFPNWSFRLPDCTAVNGLHAQLVVGTRHPVATIPGLAERLPGVQVVLRHGEQVVDRGVGANVLGSPLLALAHLVGVLASQPWAALTAGEVVTTGVITDAHPVAIGETWSTEISGMPLAGLILAFE